MNSIRLLRDLSLPGSKALKLESSDNADQSLLKQAQEAVSKENKLAAIDYSTLSGTQFNSAGSFMFNWTHSADGSGTLDISYQSAMTNPSAAAAGESASHFSLRISIGASGTVSLPEEITTSKQHLQGPDFIYSNNGLLQLQSDLAGKIGLDLAPQVDLNGKLDDGALAMLKRLGLIGQDGKATQLLQFLSDFAGLDRFKSGQQVGRSAETNYGMSDKAIGLRRQMLQSLKMLAAMAPSTSQQPAANGTGAPAVPETSEMTATQVKQNKAPVASMKAPANATPATASTSTAAELLDALIQTLEAAQQQKDKQAQAAQRAASQAAIAAVRARQVGNSDANVQQAEQEASRAMQIASQAQQAANLAKLALQNARLQQQASGKS